MNDKQRKKDENFWKIVKTVENFWKNYENFLHFIFFLSHKAIQ